ncbi:mannosyltransferase YkcB-related protein, partial [Caproiciproducens sp.]
LKQLVSEGKVTYFLVSEQSGMARGSNSEITSYVKENAVLVDPSEYGGDTGSSASGTQSSYSLYCFQQS